MHDHATQYDDGAQRLREVLEEIPLADEVGLAAAAARGRGDC
jgi:hypothetical protein